MAVAASAPIAVVQAQPLLYRDAVVDGIAFTKPPLRQVGGRLSDFEPSGSTITYVFCGQAQGCALPQEASGEIGLLLQRESLELALYTFKYWPDVRSIVTLLPANGRSSAAVNSSARRNCPAASRATANARRNR